MKQFLLALFLFMHAAAVFCQQQKTPVTFHALVLAERGGIHEGFVVAALEWLNQFSLEQHFDFHVINHTDSIGPAYLSHYQLFIQLNFPPYMWSDSSKEALQKYLEEGSVMDRFHHASCWELLMVIRWDWFSQFMGGIRKNYISARARQNACEDKNHPVMKGLPDSFSLPDDEW